MSMDSSFEPATIESKWYAQWEANGWFKPSGQGQPYSIMLPPPNVTGTLHMGHAFQHTVMDTLIRYHRMRGCDTLWQLGTDHAGIATEMVVTRLLATEGSPGRNELGRDKFIERVWAWKGQSGDTIERQMRRMGVSGDWNRTVFTMDEGPSQAVVETFVRLFEQGLIYRGMKLVNWDPVLKTAISDLEVLNEEKDGFLWSIRYPLADGSGELVVATTRPETMLGDVAVAVHPEDERYAHLVGKHLRLPLTDREIPVIADAYVEREFGTGCVKITPAHDFNDYAIGERHQLTPINIFNDDATVNANAPEKYRGLDRFVARKAVLADLEAAGLLVEEKKHKLMVPTGDRTGQVIEPYLTWQWFVKMDGLAARGLELVESGKVRFVPENWINTYRHWLGNIQDWCISRQLWWGHRIPAWYDDAGNTYVARTEDDALAQAAAKHGGTAPALRREADVLETWFSSSLWSHSTLGWPDEAAMAQRGFDRYLPSSVLVTGFDIIFFWVARMIMMTDHFTGKVPFKDVYITGLVRDKDGQKMSKSKGNVLDPIDIVDGIGIEELVAKRTTGLMKPQDAPKIEKATRKDYPEGIAPYGADALRFTFASLATHGRDIKFDLDRCGGYKNFCNKLWNAARFVLMNVDNGPIAPAGTAVVTEPEKWILSRLHHCLATVEAQFEAYRFDLVSQALYEFTWNEFCDWFLELAKPALGGDDAQAAASTRLTLLTVLETLLRALHPLIPFITEEVWQNVKGKLGIDAPTVSLQAYPRAADIAVDAGAQDEIEWLKTVVSQLRRIRSEMGLAPKVEITLLYGGGNAADRARATKFAASIAFLAKVTSQRWLEAGEEEPAASAAIVGELKILIPLAGLIDIDAEKARLAKEIKRVEGEIEKVNAKFGNEAFVSRAPAAVVDEMKQRLAEFTTMLAGLKEQLRKLEGL